MARTLRGRPLDLIFTVRFLADSRAVVSLMDITTRKQMERSLRESEARFRNMADNAPVMVWVTDTAAVCTYLSKSWYAFTGQTAETGLGFGWLDAVHPEDRRHALDAFTAANEKREPFRLDYRLRRHDGIYRWAIDAAAPRFADDGEFLGYVGSVIDITERKEAETTQQLLLAELNHRVKNTLATVQALAQQTARRAPGLQEFLPAFEGRLHALSNAHSLLTRTVWRGADLRDLVHQHVVLGAIDELRVVAQGPSLMLGPQMTVHLALVLHELTTNARKYGALSNASGSVTIQWTVQKNTLHLKWAEWGGPPVQPFSMKGFGTQLIEQTIRSHRGEVRMQSDPPGITWTIALEVPPADTAPGDEAQMRTAAPKPRHATHLSVANASSSSRMSRWSR